MDPLSVTSGVLALATFAFQSSVTLYTTIRALRSQDRSARELKAELVDLNGVLETLLETIANHPEINFDKLKQPLHRCGKVCEDYGKLVAECTKHSGSRPSVRDWAKQTFLQGDINDFKSMLALYKSTINIALADVNIRIAAVTPRVLEDYKDMLQDTKAELLEHLVRLSEKVDALEAGGAQTSTPADPEWQAMVEERETTNQGLSICAQLSAKIAELEAASKEHPSFSQRPSAQKHIKSSLDVSKGPIQSLLTRLQSHLADLESKMSAMRSTASSEAAAAEISRLQETTESLNQCITVVSDASDHLANDNRNMHEQISVSGNAYDVSVSTVGALFTMRRITLTENSRRFTGQVSDETVQKTMAGLVQLDIEKEKAGSRLATSLDRPRSESQGSEPEGYHPRYGRGFRLNDQKESAGAVSNSGVEKGSGTG
ncbi:hypothetical protein GQ53DRAFT_713957 [Thozetella sp. PMI_491]|nr:hypothetical protein GQ53DRAFT_713957 [Thozetella sp. PMI_491]